MTGPVLIIEDEPDMVLRYALEKPGFNTRSALTGEEGLNASLDRTNPPSLILLDLLLPGMNGPGDLPTASQCAGNAAHSHSDQHGKGPSL
jgi:DNA-binding response OmpR family regulator